MNELELLEERHASELGRLQRPPADRQVLEQLVQTSCLLELAKLTAAGLDLAGYLTLAVDVLDQFVGGVTCGIGFEVEGLPAMTAGGLDRVEGEQPAAPDGTELRLRLQAGGGQGVLAVRGPEADRAFFGRVAEQLASGIGAVIEADRLRRQAAAANALRLAASLAAGADGTDLDGLVDSLAALPGAVAARLLVDHPAVLVPTVAETVAWRPAAGEQATTWSRPVGEGRIELGIRWATPPGPSDTATVEAVLAAMEAALEQVDTTRRLRREAEMDPLTGVGNRRRGDRVLNTTIARATRQGEAVALLACDLDHFKRVNDELGHATGDGVLRAFGALLGEQVRSYDTVVRMGGEEFLIILPATDAVGARSLAARLRVLTPDRCGLLLPPWWRQTVSIGIAVFPDTAADAEQLLRQADAALYRAKQDGRDTVMIAGVE